MRCYVSVGLSLLACFACGQRTTSLAQYLQSHSWDVAKDGPLLVLEPDKTPGGDRPSSFAAFDRKVVAVGSITALVPRTMIVIDTSAPKEPNLYEGLPIQAKVLYLLRSLNVEQWRKVASSGISIGDLRGEQKRVLGSIIPNPLAWRVLGVDNPPVGSLSGDERLSVRLMVERTFNLEVQSVDGRSGQTILAREYKDRLQQLPTEEGKETAYGHPVRQEVNNTAKPSELNYGSPALSKVLSVPANATVETLIAQVNSSCGLEIIPDYRVAKRAVRLWGQSVSARDLLKALAWSVEGTYRKVGAAYVLTSDLEGMGARAFKIAYWQGTLAGEANHASAKLRLEVGANEGFRRVPFTLKGNDAPSSDLVAKIDLAEHQDKSASVSISELPTELRNMIEQAEATSTDGRYRKDKIRVTSDYSFHFVLPDGREFAIQSILGTGSMFSAHGPQNFGSTQLPVHLAEGSKLNMMVAAEDAASAASAVKTLAQYPVGKIWLDTHHQSALQSAIKEVEGTGIQVGLALRPWRVPTRNPDRTWLGEFGRPVFERFENLAEVMPDTAELMEDRVAARFGTWISPSDPEIGSVLSRYQELASMPGLAGVALLETQTFGYEPQRPRAVGSPFSLEWAALPHGYTMEQRLSFLRAEAVDPIDIGDTACAMTVNLEQPFFPDPALHGRGGFNNHFVLLPPNERQERWSQFLAKLNRTVTDRLVGLLGDKVQYMEPRMSSLDHIPSLQELWVAWKPGQPLVAEPANGRMMMDMEGDYWIIPMPYDSDSEMARMATSSTIRVLTNPKMSRGRLVLLDLERIPPAKLPVVLAKWFKSTK